MTEEDPVERARRHVRAEQTEKTVVFLQQELIARDKQIAELQDRLKKRTTNLTKKLDRNTRWTIGCCVLVLIALVGPTDKVAAFVAWIIDKYSKTSAK